MPTPKPYRKKDGGTSWRVRFRVAGRGSRETTETFPTLTRANAFARDIDDLGPARALQRLEETLQRQHEVTVDRVADEFLTWKTPRVRSDRTIADYRRDYRLWIKPTFGHRLASAVTTDDVRLWVDGMVSGTIARGKPSSTKSILDRHALLHAIMAHAVRTRHAPINVCVGTELPKKRKGQPKGMRPAEYDALHAALHQLHPDAADLVEFLLASGWRWSEAIDLTTYDVEDDGGEYLWVTMGHVARRNAAGRVVSVEDAKSEAGMRRVKLDPKATDMVRRRLAWASPGDLLFTTPRTRPGVGGRRWHYSDFRRDYWNPAVKAANLRRQPTPHWLRHSGTGWFLQDGASLAGLQARLGHESIETTVGTYGRLVSDVRDDELDRFAAMRGARTLPAVISGTITRQPTHQEGPK